LLQSAAETRGGGLILAGTSNSDKKGDKTVAGNGQTDFWVVKLASGKNDEVIKKAIEVYPNPTERFVNVLVRNEALGVKNNENSIEVYDLTGRLLQNVPIRYGTTPVDLGGYASGVYVFRIYLADGEKETVKVLKKEF
jgi:hypothetical protein